MSARCKTVWPKSSSKSANRTNDVTIVTKKGAQVRDSHLDVPCSGWEIHCQLCAASKSLQSVWNFGAHSQ